MSSFKFNFPLSDEDDDLSSKTEMRNGSGAKFTVSETLDDNGCLDDNTDNLACEVELALYRFDAKGPGTAEFCFNGHYLQILSGPSVEGLLRNGSVAPSLALRNAITRNSDLEAGQYEGGLKLWECAVDLCRYLEACDILMSGCSVLELGCGGGLPGMLAAKMGADVVHFQDFNKDVLEVYTMQNILINFVDCGKFSFFSGDWNSFASLALKKNLRYDIILTSETIYNTASYPKLHKVFTSVLKKTGIVLLAAKSVYFGVGGGVDSFIKFVDERQQLQAGIVRNLDRGVFRKILHLQWI